MKRIITKEQAEDLQSLHSGVMITQSMSRGYNHEDKREAEKAYNDYIKSLGLDWKQAEQASWIVVKAWNNDETLPERIILK